MTHRQFLALDRETQLGLIRDWAAAPRDARRPAEDAIIRGLLNDRQGELARSLVVAVTITRAERKVWAELVALLDARRPAAEEGGAPCPN